MLQTQTQTDHCTIHCTKLILLCNTSVIMQKNLYFVLCKSIAKCTFVDLRVFFSLQNIYILVSKAFNIAVNRFIKGPVCIVYRDLFALNGKENTSMYVFLDKVTKKKTCVIR